MWLVTFTNRAGTATNPTAAPFWALRQHETVNRKCTREEIGNRSNAPRPRRQGAFLPVLGKEGVKKETATALEILY